MKTKTLTAFLLTLLIATSCENAKTIENKLQKDVIDVHDVIMARMGEINEAQYKLDSLKNKLGELKNIKPETDTLAFRNTIDSLKEKLTSADGAMMDWMHQFNPDYTGKSHEEIVEYLNKEKAKIDSVGVLFEESLSKSAEILSKNK